MTSDLIWIGSDLRPGKIATNLFVVRAHDGRKSWFQGDKRPTPSCAVPWPLSLAPWAAPWVSWAGSRRVQGLGELVLSVGPNGRSRAPRWV